jgi:hypothetical protein
MLSFCQSPPDCRSRIFHPLRRSNGMYAQNMCFTTAEFAFVIGRSLLESLVHKLLIFLSAWLCLTAGVLAADTFTLANGASLSGDIVKFDDYDAMIHTSADTYTNIQWPQFSQDTLKQLSANPKYRALATPFIAPMAGDVPPPPSVSIKEPVRMKSPAKLHPSIIGGLVSSSLGLFLLFLIYAANLYAAFEVAVVRGKPVAVVMAISAVLPIAGPAIFLLQPAGTTAAVEEPLENFPPGEAPPPGVGPAGAAPGGAPEDIQIVSASWQPSQEEKKPKAQPQVFSRGKFTFNKRFIETKFANYIGDPKAEAKNFNMEIKTLKDTFAVECIKQIGPTEAILETPNGQTTVAFGDIQEIKLIPKTS